EVGTCATSGRELASENVTSPLRGSAAVTRPFEPCEPVVIVGSSVSEVGCGCGVGVVVPSTETPFHVAVIVTVVDCNTWLVGIVTEVGEVTWAGVKLNSGRELVAGTGTDAGKGAACEFELERFTVAPPAGARLLRCRSTNTCRPLVGVGCVRVIVFTCSGP